MLRASTVLSPFLSRSPQTVVGARHIWSWFSKAATKVEPAFAPHLSTFVCPFYKVPLFYDEEGNQLVNEEQGLAYPIKNGIPVFLPEETTRVSLKE